ncbi:MAG: GreA/GreB family elongation factor [Sandaracinaceae bacterium]|nr:GreA/GreB family elongation factor [Sandaracinaceae bacterium]
MAQLPDKQAVIAALRAELEGRIARAAARAEQARADATHEEARAENDKDTRGLETSYLARGQAQRAEELVEALHRVRLLAPRSYGEDDPIGLGALVCAELEDGEARTFFLLDVAGGTEVTLDPSAPPVWVVSPSSPVGRALVGRLVGDEVTIARAGAPRTYDIVAVA